MKSVNFKFKALMIATVLHIIMLIALFWGAQHNATSLSNTSLWQGSDVAYMNLDLNSSTDNATTTQNSVTLPNKTSQAPNFGKTPITEAKDTTTSQPSAAAAASSSIASGDGLDSTGSTSPNTLALIRKKIAQNKIIPTDADAQPLSGTVKVGFKINENGQIEALAVLKSSGVAALDQAALKTIQRAAPLPHFKNPIAIDLEYQ